ncbi:MAG: CcmD family protein [Actinomycetota bacterium]
MEASKLLYLGIGFSLVWVAIAAYLFSLSRRQRSLEERMDRLRRGPNGGS